MRKLWLWLALALCPFSPSSERVAQSADEARVQRHRSPVDVALLPGGRAITANQTADSISLVDLAQGRVLQERTVGQKPSAVACAADGRRAAVSSLWSGTVTLLEVRQDSLDAVGEVRVGAMPRGLVFAPDGGSLYVALGGAHEVVQIDWQTRKQLRAWPAPIEPRQLALTRDGRHLAAISGRSAQVRCWDTQTGKQVWERTILDAFNLHGLAFSADDKELVAAHLHDRRHAIAKNNIEQGWALDNRLTRLTLEPSKQTDYWQIGLDTRGEAVGDPCAVAFSAKGDWLAIAAAGTHEVLLMKTAAVHWSSGDPGDFLDASLGIDDSKFRRIPVGGRPMALRFLPDSDQLVIVNYLLDSLQLLDVKTGKLTRTIALGGPEKPSLARQGEVIFYDAKRSHHQWFSCHSCHPDGHTNGRNFDTLNDDSYSNPKLTPTLRGVTRTGPWTWHGWQKELSQAIEKSLTETQFGPKPTQDDIKAMLAYFETLDHPPNPHRNPDGSISESAKRGQALFFGKARCDRCHHGEQYTSDRNYDVKLEPDNSPYDLWNPPSLRGLHDRGPYLHDARAETLEELLRSDHAPQKLGGQPITPEERRDLIEFLKTL